MNASQNKPTGVEESFRTSLTDVVTIAEKLAGHCGSVEDLITVCRTAIESDAHLRLLMSLVRQQGKR